MILLDLQLTLFLLLLGVLGGVGSAYYLAWYRTYQRYAIDANAWQSLETLPFGVVILHTDGTMLFRNSAARQVFDTLATTISANPVEALQHLGIPLEAAMSRYGKMAQPLALRWWSYPLDGQHRLLALADDNESQRLLRQQQTFIGQLSHELRSPLTALIAHAEVLRQVPINDAVARSSVEMIQGESQRIARLVRDMLELYRLEISAELPLQPTDLVLLAEDAIATLILRAEELGLALTFTTEARLPKVLAHADRLHQVFVNVLNNAINYCRPNDTITVRLEAHPDGVRCVVADSGPGIVPTDLPHVTEPLYRGRTDIPGSGMGLTLASEILRQHYATLMIESVSAGASTGTTCWWVLRAAGSGRSGGAVGALKR